MNPKNSSLDPNIIKEIEDAGGNISKVARILGLDYHALKARVTSQTSVQTKVRVIAPEPEDFRDLAKPSLRPYAIACRRCIWGWPVQFQDAIEEGRRLYDAGTHEMCQSRNQGWIVLYVIPRLVPTAPRTYFSTMERFI